MFRGLTATQMLVQQSLARPSHEQRDLAANTRYRRNRHAKTLAKPPIRESLLQEHNSVRYPVFRPQRRPRAKSTGARQVCCHGIPVAAEVGGGQENAFTAFVNTSSL